VDVPETVSKEFASAKNRQVLAGWVKILPKDERQDFIDNMLDVIIYAQQNNINTTDAVNSYKQLKFDNLGTTGFDRVERVVTRGTVIAGILFGVMLLFSLVLVLLAIERNTRLGLPWKMSQATQAGGADNLCAHCGSSYAGQGRFCTCCGFQNLSQTGAAHN